MGGAGCGVAWRVAWCRSGVETPPYVIQCIWSERRCCEPYRRSFCVFCVRGGGEFLRHRVDHQGRYGYVADFQCAVCVEYTFSVEFRRDDVRDEHAVHRVADRVAASWVPSGAVVADRGQSAVQFDDRCEHVVVVVPDPDDAVATSGVHCGGLLHHGVRHRDRGVPQCAHGSGRGRGACLVDCFPCEVRHHEDRVRYHADRRRGRTLVRVLRRIARRRLGDRRFGVVRRFHHQRHQPHVLVPGTYPFARTGHGSRPPTPRAGERERQIRQVCRSGSLWFRGVSPLFAEQFRRQSVEQDACRDGGYDVRDRFGEEHARGSQVRDMRQEQREGYQQDDLAQDRQEQ